MVAYHGSGASGFDRVVAEGVGRRWYDAPLMDSEHETRLLEEKNNVSK